MISYLIILNYLLKLTANFLVFIKQRIIINHVYELKNKKMAVISKSEKVWRLPGPRTPPAFTCYKFEWGADTGLNKAQGVNKFKCTYDTIK